MKNAHLAMLACSFAALAGCGTAAQPRGTGAEAAAPERPGEQRVASDADGDGKPDTWTFTSREGGKDVAVRREKDVDGDGKVDEWEDLDAEGRTVRLRIDADRDGLPDVTLVFEKGTLVRREIAVKGKTRVWQHYENGQLVRKVRDTDGDERADYWEEWSRGVLQRVGVDRDGDGKPDSWDAAGPPGPAR